VSIEYYIAGFNFDQGSNYLPNWDMEANSYWSTSGDQSSSWYSNSYASQGNRAFAFNVTTYFDVGSQDLRLSSGVSKKAVMDYQMYGLIGGVTYPNAGKDVAEIASKLGCSSNGGYAYFYSLGISFRTIENIPAGSVITKAYLTTKCFSSGNPRISQPLLIKVHDIDVYSLGMPWSYSTYEGPVYKQTSLESENRYFGDTTSYYYDMSSAFNFMIGSLTAINTTSWINIWIKPTSHADGGISVAGFYCESHSSVASTSLGDLVIQYTKPGVGSPGLNYVYHQGLTHVFRPSSNYAIGFNLTNLVGENAHRVKLLTSDASSILFDSGVLDIQGEVYLPISFSGVTSAPMLKIEYTGVSLPALSFIDNVYVGINRSWGAIGVLQIYPEWEMKRFTKQNRHEHRTKGGKLYSYTWGQYNRFEVPVEYVSNSKALIINSWWATDALIYFKIYSGGVWEVNTCHLMNDSAPLPSLVRPYTNYRKGTLTLETF
jgi:hypothetical protein